MKTLKLVAVLLPAIVLSACSSAKQSTDIEASFVAQDKYRGMSCSALRKEAEQVQATVAELGGEVDEAYKEDKALEAVTWLLFWPAAIAMDGNDEETSKFAAAKGQAEAIAATMKSKRCRMG